MAVFRVERNKGYTVMTNYHLRDRNLSLKSKGLLSQMLSLPEDWDYTLKGLSSINKESIDAIRTAVWELEKAGYITRRQGRDEQGKMASIEYTIYETPQRTAPGLENPTPDQPWLENPISENPTPENPIPENPMQLIKEELNKDLQGKDRSITESYPIPSCPDNYEDTALPERKRKDGKEAYQVYEEIIKDNIEFDWLIKAFPHDRDMLDEIVSLILETVSSRRKYLRIAGDDYPAELVKSKFMKLNSGHIEYVLDCMHQNTTKVRNIKKYMLAVLFNAPSTIGSYYTALVNHDLYGGT